MLRPETRTILPALAIILVGINLRPALASVSPLLDTIQHHTGLGDSSASLLTTLPVLLMGVCLLGTRKLFARITPDRAILASLALIAAACAARFLWPGAGSLLLTAVIAGIGIAIVQAVIPIVIRARSGDAASRMMGLYSTAIMGGAALASAATPLIAQDGHWAAGLGIWSIPALLGMAAWFIASRNSAPLTPADSALTVSAHPRAWLLMAFFGLGTAAYTLVLAWLPPYYTRMGWSESAAGAMLGIVTLAEVGAGILVSAVIGRFRDRRPALLVALMALLLGLLCLTLAPRGFHWPAIILSGLGIGALFPLSLILAMDHGRNAAETGVIISFVQGGGYILAAFMPFAAGIIRENMAGLAPAWGLMAGLTFIMVWMLHRFAPGQLLDASPGRQTRHSQRDRAQSPCR
ncbi:MFS transporter [Altericroceibacterium spongiae]|uniref:MFS transporter n=1 Tax=Altericroceibacterium spongiae TaxID=2320269 RepID=A0A420EJW8_9SPHN|nr:MFS transporter [Altericroceibacterium spongiae]RKF21011.1 MFS transporter [Altericroceibacterium spongiae]